jgi:hypothetical protein
MISPAATSAPVMPGFMPDITSLEFPPKKERCASSNGRAEATPFFELLRPDMTDQLF